MGFFSVGLWMEAGQILTFGQARNSVARPFIDVVVLGTYSAEAFESSNHRSDEPKVGT